MAKITIEDVAQQAGVSIKTVSRVVNKEPNVRQSTRDKVLKVIDALQYRPDPFARSLASSRSFLIGLLYDNPSASYVTNIQEGALKACKAERYELLIHPCDHLSPKLAQEIVALVEQSRLDGVLLTPPLCDTPAVLDALDAKNAPYVSIAPSASSSASRAVHTNDRDICAEMTGYLASLGHSKIGFIIGHPDHKAVGNRYSGYKDGLKSNGLEFDEKFVAQGYNTFESGIDCGTLLLQQADRPTAIFASNDEMATGLMRVAHQLHIRIPEDLSVVGFDDIPLAKQIYPALTTIRQPMKAMAEKATRILLGTLRNEKIDDEMAIIPCTSQIRESTSRQNNL